MLRVEYSEPYNGRLALSHRTFAFLKKNVLLKVRFNRPVTESELADVIRQFGGDPDELAAEQG